MKEKILLSLLMLALVVAILCKLAAVIKIAFFL